MKIQAHNAAKTRQEEPEHSCLFPAIEGSDWSASRFVREVIEFLVEFYQARAFVYLLIHLHRLMVYKFWK